MFKLFKKKTKEVLKTREKNNISNELENLSISDFYKKYIITQYDFKNIIKIGLTNLIIIIPHSLIFFNPDLMDYKLFANYILNSYLLFLLFYSFKNNYFIKSVYFMKFNLKLSKKLYFKTLNSENIKNQKNKDFLEKINNKSILNDRDYLIMANYNFKGDNEEEKEYSIFFKLCKKLYYTLLNK